MTASFPRSPDSLIPRSTDRTRLALAGFHCDGAQLKAVIARARSARSNLTAVARIRSQLGA
jgi:hypothetical protein